jgi:hypothetical protein
MTVRNCGRKYPRPSAKADLRDRSYLFSPWVRNQLEDATNSIALEYGENRVRRSLATRIRHGLLLQKCAEQMGQLHLRVNAIGRSRSIFGECGKLVN